MADHNMVFNKSKTMIVHNAKQLNSQESLNVKSEYKDKLQEYREAKMIYLDKQDAYLRYFEDKR